MLRAELAMVETFGAQYVSLHVRVSNKAAIHLYTRTLGFDQEKTEARYYADGEDAFCMRLDLGGLRRQIQEARADEEDANGDAAANGNGDAEPDDLVRGGDGGDLRRSLHQGAFSPGGGSPGKSAIALLIIVAMEVTVGFLVAFVGGLEVSRRMVLLEDWIWGPVPTTRDVEDGAGVELNVRPALAVVAAPARVAVPPAAAAPSGSVRAREN